jgi:hypothetical protein
VAPARARGVLVHLPDRPTADGIERPTEEYPAGDGWSLEQFEDGVWLTVLDTRGRQVATFRPKTYERPEIGRMKPDA